MPASKRAKSTSSASSAGSFRVHLSLDSHLDVARHLLEPFQPKVIQEQVRIISKKATQQVQLKNQVADQRKAKLSIQSYDAAPIMSGPSASTAAAPQTPHRVVSQHVASTSSPLASPRSLERSTAPQARWEQTGVFGGVDEGAAQEVAFGIVHLFRTEDPTSALSLPGTPAQSSKLQPSKSGGVGTLERQQQQLPQQQQQPPRTILTDDAPEDAGTILAVLAVPSHMHASDWLAFVESAVEAFEHVRIVRESSPGRCLILIKFREAIDAEFFHREFNNVPFNAMHPNDLCRVVYVTSITLSSSTLAPVQALANTDPWPLPSASKVHAGIDRERELELPTCPVCLDRMDSSVTGLMTVSCQHSFHCACLSRWEDSRCPVCRYSQSRRRRIEGPGAASSSATGAGQGSSSRAAEEDDEAARENVCAVCGTTDDLWVCLICAAVGCGRYKGGHAHSHFDATVHAYSLELETQRVWSYVEDSYVHRLIQSKADGKLVELPSATGASSSRDEEGASGNVAARGPMYDSEKLDAMGAEYSMLLTSQLDTQRSFYEEQVRGAQSKLSEALAALDEAHMHSSSSTQRESSLSARVTALELELSHSRAAAERSEARASKALEMVRKLQTDLQGERSVSEGLMRRLEKSKAKEDEFVATVEEIKAQNADLQEQMRDLMFFVSARDKLQEGEAAGGDIEGVAEAKKAKAKKKKK